VSDWNNDDDKQKQSDDSADKPSTPPVNPPRFWGRPENDDQSQQPPADQPPAEQTPPPWEPPAYEAPSPEPPSFQPPVSESSSSSFPPPGGGAQDSGGQFPPPFTPPTGDAGSGQNFAAPFQAPDHKFAGRTLDLRPLTVADILDSTFYLMRRYWKQLGIAALVYAVPAGAIQALQRAATSSGDSRFIDDSSSLSIFTNITNTSADLDGSRLAVAAICTILLVVISIFLQPFVEGAVTRQVAAAYLTAR
jgi:hypothetical protein